MNEQKLLKKSKKIVLILASILLVASIVGGVLLATINTATQEEEPVMTVRVLDISSLDETSGEAKIEEGEEITDTGNEADTGKNAVEKTTVERNLVAGKESIKAAAKYTSGTTTYINSTNTVTLQLDGTDDTKIKTSSLTAANIVVKVGGTAVTPTTKTLSTASAIDHGYRYTLTLAGIPGNGVLTIEIAEETLTDESLNKSAKTVFDSNDPNFQEIIIDNQGPGVTFGTNGSTTYAKSRSTTVTVADTSSGLVANSLKYVWTNSTTAPANESDFTGTFTNGGTITSPESVTGNNWYLWILAKDNVGNVSKTKSNVFYLDNAGPINFTVSAKYNNASGSAYVEDTWAQKIYVSFAATDANSGIKQFEWTTGSSWGTSSIKQNGDTAYITFTANRNQTIKFRVIDNLDNPSDVLTVKMQIDKDPPTVTASDITYGETLNITLNDSYSGVSAWQVKAGSGTTAPTSGWTDISPAVKSSTQTATGLTAGTHTIWVKDQSGRTAYKTITVSQYKLATPTVSIDTDGKVTWPAVTNATGYQIKFAENGTWESATSGSKYVDKTSTGTKTAYVQAINSDTTNYINSDVGNKSVEVYSLTLSKGTGISAVSNGGTSTTNACYYVNGKQVAIDATVSEGYTWSTWTKSAGTNPAAAGTKNTTVTIGANTTLTATANANPLTFNDVTINKNYNADATNTFNVTAASNGTGSYKYEEVSEKNGNTNTSYITITTAGAATIAKGTPAGTYTYVIRATDNNSGVTKDATYTVVIAKIAATNTVTISGTATYGQTLTANVDTNSDGTKSYQWYYATSKDATSGTNISGATGATYTVANVGSKSMVGKFIGCKVTIAEGTNWLANTGVTKTTATAIAKATPTITFNPTTTSAEINYDQLKTFKAKSNVAGTLTATSADATYVEITGGASNNATANTEYTITYKGKKYRATSTVITVKISPTDSANWNEATKHFTVTKVNKIASTNPTLADVTATYNRQAHAISITANGAGGTTKYRTSTDNSTWGDWSTTIPSLTDVGKLYVQAKVFGDENHNDTTQTASKSITITAANMSTPSVSIDTDGKVTWGAITGATSYQISFDNSTWETATSGSKYVNKTSAGTKTAYVRAVSTSSNYNSPSSAGSKSVEVYSLTLSKGTGISAVSNGGTSTASACYYVSGKQVAIDATVGEGHTWSTWTKSAGTAPASATTKSTTVTIGANTTLTASATANTYTVSYAGMDGASFGTNHPTSATYGVQFTVNNPTKTGYSFTGWQITGMDSVTHTYGSSTTTETSISSTKETTFKNLRSTSGTVTFTAQWSINDYTITYNYNGVKNYAIPTTANGSYTKSSFSGAQNQCITIARMYTDELTASDKVTVTCDVSYTNLTAAEGKTASAWGQASGNHTSWSPSLGGGSKKYWLGTGSETYSYTTTMSADKIKNKYFNIAIRMDYYASGSITFSNIIITRTTTESSSKTYATQLGTLPTPVETGYTLDGWYTAATGGTKISDTTTVPAEDTTYYAHWTANTYTIAYAGMDGASYGTNHPTSGTYGTDVIINNPTKAGYTFTGWTSSTGDGLSTITAVRGPVDTAESTTYAIATTGTTTNPYTLWDGASTKNTYFRNLRKESGTVTLTANWTANKVTVTLKKDGSNSTALNGYKVYISTSSSTNSKTWNGTTTASATLDISGAMKTDTTYYVWIGKDSNHKTADADMAYTGASFTGASAATATVNFYTITASLSNTTMKFNGTSVANNGTVVALGTTSAIHLIEATPSTGYTFSSWTSNNANTTISSASTASTSLSKVGAAATLTATSTDTTAPVISVSPTSCTVCKSKNVTISIAENGSGLSTSNSYQYYLSSSNTALSNGKWMNYTNGTAFALGDNESSSGEAVTGTRYLFVKRVVDNATNTSTTNGTAKTISSVTYQMFGSYEFDNSAPTCTITASTANSTNASSITYTFTWSENLAAGTFTADDITVTNGTKGTFTETTTNKVYTLVVTNSGSCEQTVTVAANKCTDAVGNNNVQASKTITIDRTKPRCTITTDPDNNPTNSSTVKYIFTWNENLASGTFTKDDINIYDNDSLESFDISSATFTETVANRTYTLDVTYSENIEVLIDVAANTCTDAVGNGNYGTSISHEIDIVAPTCIITANVGNLTNASTITYTFEWSEELANGTFTADDIAVTNGTKGTLTTVTANKKYTMQVTNGTTGTQIVSIDNNKCTDDAGNGNIATSKEISIDRIVPTLTSINVIDPADGTYGYVDPDEITCPPFEKGDINGDGIVNQIDSNYLSRYLADWDGYTISGEQQTYAADLNNDGSINTIDRNILSRCISGYIDYIVTYLPNAYLYKAITIEATYSENIYADANKTAITASTAPELKVAFGGTVGARDGGKATFSSVDGNKITYIYYLKTGDNGAMTSYSHTGTVYDQAGNSLSVTNKTIGGSSIVADTTAPTCTITASPSADPTNANSVTYTFTWSETLENNSFTIGDIDIDDIDLSSATFTEVVANKEYSLTIPFSDNNDYDVYIYIDAEACKDAAGNYNLSEVEFEQTIDRTAPTCTITQSTSGSVTTYTFEWSETLANGTFTANDITVTNGTKGTLTTVTANKKYTMQVTSTGGSITVTIPADKCTDLAGNGNQAVSTNTTVDLTPPTISGEVVANIDSTNQLTITVYSAADNTGGSGIDKYKVYNGNTLLNSSTSNAVTVSSNTAWYTADFTVAVIDKAGNECAKKGINYYTVGSQANLQGLRASVNSGGTFSGRTVRQISNITITETNWSPIGNSSTNTFSGTYYGGSVGSSTKTQRNITNLKSVDINSTYAGLFGRTNGANISHIKLVNADVEFTTSKDVTSNSMSTFVGPIVAYAYSTSITNCEVDSTSKAINLAKVDDSHTVYLGGLVGYAEGVTMSECINRATVTSYTNNTACGKKARTGGVIGYIQTNGKTYYHLYNYGTVTGRYDTGGIAGAASGATYSNRIIFDSCVNQGNVTMNSADYDVRTAGGIVGYASNHTQVIRSNNSGTITAEKAQHTSSGYTYGFIGGIVGYADAAIIGDYNHSDYLCKNTGSIVAKVGAGAGGIVGRIQGGQICYAENSGTVSGNGTHYDNYAYFGGIVGWNEVTYVYSCKNTGSITSSANKNRVGGIVGYNRGVDTATYSSPLHTQGARVHYCTNTGNVSGGGEIGGIAGADYATASDAKVSVENCTVSAGTVTGTGNYVGGIVGNNMSYGKVLTNTNSSSGTISGPAYVGGIAGNNSGTITSCVKTGGNVTSSGAIAGGIVGSNASTVSSCVPGAITVQGTTNVGGVAGYNTGTVQNCNIIDNCTVKSSAAISSETQGVGGIVGKNGNDTTSATISGCQFKGTVKVGGSSGGIAGCNYGTISQCSNNGTFSALYTGNNNGGIVGVLRSGTVQECSNRAPLNYVYGSGITNSSIENVGGIAGLQLGGTIQYCYNREAHGGKTSVGGLIGWMKGGTVKNSYSIEKTYTSVASNVGRGLVVGSHASGTIESTALFIKEQTLNSSGTNTTTDFNTLGNGVLKGYLKVYPAVDSNWNSKFYVDTAIKNLGYPILQWENTATNSPVYGAATVAANTVYYYPCGHGTNFTNVTKGYNSGTNRGRLTIKNGFGPGMKGVYIYVPNTISNRNFYAYNPSTQGSVYYKKLGATSNTTLTYSGVSITGAGYIYSSITNLGDTDAYIEGANTYFVLLGSDPKTE